MLSLRWANTIIGDAEGQATPNEEDVLQAMRNAKVATAYATERTSPSGSADGYFCHYQDKKFAAHHTVDQAR